MAKTIAIRVPRLPAARGRARGMARRAFGAAATAVRDEKHTLTAVGAAYVVGYMNRPGADGKTPFASLPLVDKLGVPGALGAAAFIGARFTKSRVLRHVATGLLSAAAYSAGNKPKDAASGEMDD